MSGRPVRLIDIAIRESAKQASIGFEELVKGCTPEEREQVAWHLAMLRARKTFEKLRRPTCAALPIVEARERVCLEPFH